MKFGKGVFIASVILVWLSPITALATIRNVPAQYSTIQAGIDASGNGDTVLVAPGIYYEHLNIYRGSTTNITLASLFLTTNETSYIYSTIIDGGGIGRCVNFDGSNNYSTIIGFTIQNGYATAGAGIYALLNNPRIKWNIIKNNNTGDYTQGTGEGAGICAFVFYDNGYGAVIEHNTIFNNWSNHWAGGIYLANGGYNLGEMDRIILEHNTIYNNQAQIGGGCFFTSCDTNNYVANNIIYGNQNFMGNVSNVIIDPYSTVSPNICYCDIEGGLTGTGVIDADPLFINATESDFRLQANSPCIDAGDPASAHDPDGSRADMGAYYCYQHLRTLWNVSTSGSDSGGDGSSLNPFRTIQHGINAASNGDTVLVSDGHYYERVNFLGKAITVASEYLFEKDSTHILNTIIDADTLVLGVADTGSVVRFVNGEDSTSVLHGFTIQKGIGTLNAGIRVGGGILFSNCSPTINYCRIIDNSVYHGQGGGIYASDNEYEITLNNCLIKNNIVADCGPNHSFARQVYLVNSKAHIVENTIIDTIRNYSSVLCPNSNLIIDNSTIIGGLERGTFIVSNSLLNRSYLEGKFRIVGSHVLNAYFSEISSYYLFNDTIDVSIYCNVGPDVADTIINCVLLMANDIIIANSYIQNSNLRGGIRIPYSGGAIINSFVGGGIGFGSPSGTLYIDGSTIMNKGIKQSQPGAIINIRNSIISSFQNITLDIPGNAINQISIQCSDIYRYDSGAWYNGPAGILDTSNLYFSDPKFCDTMSENYHISSNSICAPANNGCSTLIGALDVGCSELPSFSLLYPPTDSVCAFTTQRFIWQRSFDSYYGYPTSYRFYIDDNPAFSSPESSGVLTDTSCALPEGMIHSKRYYWRVKAFNGYAPPLYCNEIWNFYIDDYPSSPAIINPPIGAFVDSLTYLTWLIGTDPDSFDMVSYEIQIDNDSLFGSPEVNDTIQNGMLLDNSISVRIKQLDGYLNLSNDNVYYWRICSLDNYGLYSPWPDTLHWFVYNHLNHPPNAPVSGFSPCNDEEVISLQPIITWNDATDPDPDDYSDNLSYIVRLAKDSSFVGFVLYDSTAMGINQFEPAVPLDDNSHYYYQVKTFDDGLLSSSWSTIQNFWTNHYNYPPEPFPLISPLPDIRRVDYYSYFNWGHTVDYDPMANFTFAFQYSPDSLFTYNVKTVFDLNDTALILPTDTLATLGQHLFWRILAIDDDSLIRIGGIPEQSRMITIVPPGDANGDGSVLGSDVTYLVRYFKGLGAAPDPIQAGDANADCETRGSDVTFLVHYFKGYGSGPVRGNCESPIILRIDRDK